MALLAATAELRHSSPAGMQGDVLFTDHSPFRREEVVAPPAEPFATPLRREPGG